MLSVSGVAHCCFLVRRVRGRVRPLVDEQSVVAVSEIGGGVKQDGPSSPSCRGLSAPPTPISPDGRGSLSSTNQRPLRTVPLSSTNLQPSGSVGRGSELHHVVTLVDSRTDTVAAIISQQSGAAVGIFIG